MFKNLKKRSEGFTIIEVMIVLAVAGLIMLIVFLAVPALQRNQRNTSRKSDAARVAASIVNFYSNGGQVPASTGDLTTIAGDAGNLAFYGTLTSTATAPATTPNNISFQTKQSAAALAAANADTMQVVTGSKCGAGGATTTSGASAKNIALQYTIESSASTIPVCIDVQ
jgi:prepilin-type N-terminal cleavage/methylation domain-containing protein